MADQKEAPAIRPKLLTFAEQEKSKKGGQMRFSFSALGQSMKGSQPKKGMEKRFFAQAKAKKSGTVLSPEQKKKDTHAIKSHLGMLFHVVTHKHQKKFFY